jgi:hypothetical protein
MQLTIFRKYDKEGTIGKLLIDGKEFCKTLERPWLNNQPDNPKTLENDSSCIPEGVYKVVRRSSEKFGKHLHLLDVPNRSFILIHSGNTIDEILGCLLVGDKILDAGTIFKGKKYKYFISNSKRTMASLLTAVIDDITLKITSENSECKI